MLISERFYLYRAKLGAFLWPIVCICLLTSVVQAATITNMTSDATSLSPELPQITLDLSNEAWMLLAGSSFDTLNNAHQNSSQSATQSSLEHQHHDSIHGLTSKQTRTIADISVPLNFISLFASLLVISAYFFARHYCPRYTSRVSLKLAATLAFVNAFYALIQLFGAFLPASLQHTNWCVFIAWGYVYCTLASVFLTSAIALNLHFIFLKRRRITTTYESLYLIMPTGLALLISVLPVFAGRFTYNVNRGMCWYKEVTQLHGIIWVWCTLFIWVILCIIYCAWAVSVVSWRLALERKHIRESGSLSDHPNQEQRSDQLSARHRRRVSVPPSELIINASLTPTGTPSDRVINRVVTRVVLYMLIPIVTQSLNITMEMDLFFSQHVSFPLAIGSFIATACQGLLNVLVVLLDPTVRTVWYCVRLELIKRYYIDVHNAGDKDDHEDLYTTASARAHHAVLITNDTATNVSISHGNIYTASTNVAQKKSVHICTRLARVCLLPVRCLVGALLRHLVYRYLLVHRNGHVYLFEPDIQPLDTALVAADTIDNTNYVNGNNGYPHANRSRRASLGYGSGCICHMSDPIQLPERAVTHSARSTISKSSLAINLTLASSSTHFTIQNGNDLLGSTDNVAGTETVGFAPTVYAYPLRATPQPSLAGSELSLMLRHPDHSIMNSSQQNDTYILSSDYTAGHSRIPYGLFGHYDQGLGVFRQSSISLNQIVDSRSGSGIGRPRPDSDIDIRRTLDDSNPQLLPRHGTSLMVRHLCAGSSPLGAVYRRAWSSDAQDNTTHLVSNTPERCVTLAASSTMHSAMVVETAPSSLSTSDLHMPPI